MTQRLRPKILARGLDKNKFEEFSREYILNKMAIWVSEKNNYSQFQGIIITVKKDKKRLSRIISIHLKIIYSKTEYL